MLYKRMIPILYPHQYYDQIGFRPGWWIEDAFATYEGLIGIAAEFNMDIWLYNVVLRKAFDQVEHQATFEAIRTQGTPECYIHLLIALYDNQRAKVNESDEFNTRHGVKQGDIVSPILFNYTLEVKKSKWKRRLTSQGWLIDPKRERLTKTRYADDIWLYAKSQHELL